MQCICMKVEWILDGTAEALEKAEWALDGMALLLNAMNEGTVNMVVRIGETVDELFCMNIQQPELNIRSCLYHIKGVLIRIRSPETFKSKIERVKLFEGPKYIKKFQKEPYPFLK